MSDAQAQGVRLEVPPLYEKRAQQLIDDLIQEHGVLYAYVGDHDFPHLTGRELETALSGFRLEIDRGRTIDWLAAGVRRILSIVSPRPDGMPDQLMSNAAKRDALKSLAARAKALSDDLADLDNDTVSNLSLLLDDSGWQIFWSTAQKLEFMADVMRLCGERLVEDQTKWRSAAKRELRVRQAHYLSPLYERAYGRDATFVDRDNAKDPGPWSDFFARMIMLAEGEKVPDLRGVLKEARRRHRENPIQYPETFIPN